MIDTVQTEIDPTQNNGEGLGLAPIGHVVTVVTAEPVTVDIQTTVTLDGVTWASVKQDVIDSLEAYFLGLRMSWANEDHLTVRVAQVDTSILSVPGVIDVGGTTLNGTAGNITLGPYEVPLLGSVSA